MNSNYPTFKDSMFILLAMDAISYMLPHPAQTKIVETITYQCIWMIYVGLVDCIEYRNII